MNNPEIIKKKKRVVELQKIIRKHQQTIRDINRDIELLELKDEIEKLKKGS